MLLVTNSSFEVGGRSSKGASVYSELAAAGLALPRDEGALSRSLSGLKVQSGLYYGRRFKLVRGKTGFGLYGSMEGCSILQTSAAVSMEDVGRALRALPGEFTRGERIAVVHHNATAQGDPEGQTYVAMPGSNLIVGCSDRELLVEMLSRKQHKAGREALPEGLPEWRWVDRTAAVWGIRHYHDEAQDPTSPRDFNGQIPYDRKATGMTFSWVSDSAADLNFLTSDGQAASSYSAAWGGIVSAPSPGIFAARFDPSKDITGTLRLKVVSLLLGTVIAL